MATNLSGHFQTLKFADGLQYLLVSQTTSKMRGKVNERTGLRGQRQQIRGLGTIDLVEKTTQYGEISQGTISHESRWMAPKIFEQALWFDNEDMVFAAMDPSSPYAMRFAEGWARKFDAVAFGKVGEEGGLLGSAYSGTAGTTEVTLASDASQIVTASSGLTWGKLVETLETFHSNDVDPDVEKYLAITPKGLTDLIEEGGPRNSISDGNSALSSYRYGDDDMTAAMQIREGKVSRLCGFTTFLTNSPRLLSTAQGGDAGTSNNYAVAFTKDALEFGIWDGPTVRVDDLPNRGLTKQIYINSILGAVRTQEKLVVRIDVAV